MCVKGAVILFAFVYLFLEPMLLLLLLCGVVSATIYNIGEIPRIRAPHQPSTRCSPLSLSLLNGCVVYIAVRRRIVQVIETLMLK